MSERDEEVVPMAQIEEVVERVLGDRASKLGLRIQFQDRQGRSEKITLLFEGGGTIVVSANTRIAGASRKGLIDFLERCEAIGGDIRKAVCESEAKPCE